MGRVAGRTGFQGGAKGGVRYRGVKAFVFDAFSYGSNIDAPRGNPYFTL